MYRSSDADGNQRMLLAPERCTSYELCVLCGKGCFREGLRTKLYKNESMQHAVDTLWRLCSHTMKLSVDVKLSVDRNRRGRFLARFIDFNA
jgi:hypothetical protein